MANWSSSYPADRLDRCRIASAKALFRVPNVDVLIGISLQAVVANVSRRDTPVSLVNNVSACATTWSML